PNVARTFASLAAYVATADDDGVQVHQFASCTVRTVLPDGTTAAFEVVTEYPVDGRIRVRIVEDGERTLSRRVAVWARGAALRDGAQPAGVVPPGLVSLRRAFRAGAVVALARPVAPRFTSPDPRVDAVRGCVAVERGPEVMALESIDFDADVA